MCVSQSDKISAAQPQQQQLNLDRHLSKASAVNSSQGFLIAGWKFSLGELPAAMRSMGIALKWWSWNGPSVKAKSGERVMETLNEIQSCLWNPHLGYIEGQMFVRGKQILFLLAPIFRGCHGHGICSNLLQRSWFDPRAVNIHLQQ